MRRFILRFVLILLALEAASRLYLFYYKIPSGERPGGWEAAKQLATSGAYVCEFRGGRYFFRKPAGTYRIFALGGSATAGHTLTEDPWPLVLERRLNASASRDRRYDVINLGWCGAHTAHEYYFLRNYRYLGPDLVIAYGGYNDIVQANSEPGAYGVSNQRIYDLLRNPSFANRLSFFLLRNSALANRVNLLLYRLVARLNDFAQTHRLFGIGNGRPIRFFEKVEWYRIQDGVYSRTTGPGAPGVRAGNSKACDLFKEAFRYNLEQIGGYLKRNRIKGLFVFQPFLPEKLMRLEGKIRDEKTSWISKNFDVEAYEFYGRFALQRKRIMRQVARKYGLFFLDACSVFDRVPDREAYVDMCHTTPRGTRLVSDLMEGYLRAHGLLNTN